MDSTFLEKKTLISTNDGRLFIGVLKGEMILAGEVELRMFQETTSVFCF